MAWHRSRQRVTYDANGFDDQSRRAGVTAPAVAVDIDFLGPPPVRRGLRRSPLPSEPFPTEVLLTSGSRGVHRGQTGHVSSHEVIRHVHVASVDALVRFDSWWPTELHLPGGVFEIVDRTTADIVGRLRRPLQRRLRIDLMLEIHAPELCAVRLTPELRSRRLVEPTESWWITAHALVDSAVAVVRPPPVSPC